MNPTWLYVAVIYALVVWLARRSRADLPLHVASIFFALVLGFLWRPLTEPVISFPADIVRLMPPWSEILPPNRPPVTKYEIANLNLHDVGMQTVPWMHQVREAWKDWRAPLWNSQAGCGYPLLANGQSTPLSIYRIATLPLSLAYAITAEAAFKLLTALVFTWLFCRRRYSAMASFIAAISYGFSTWMTTWLHFPIGVASAFLPAVLFAIDGVLENPSRRRIACAAVVFATAVAAGHPETIFHIGLIAAVFGLWVAFVEKREGSIRERARGVGGVAAASAIALVLSAPVLAPFAEAVVRSQRLAEVQVASSIVPPYSNLACALLLLQPQFFGHLPPQRPWGPTGLESICSYAGLLALAAWFGAALYVVASRRWREREAMYVLAMLVTVGVIFAWPGFTEGFHAIAGLAPAFRLRIAFCWFASLLAAWLIDIARARTPLPLLAGVAVVSLMILALMRYRDFPSDAAKDVALLAFLPGLAVLALATVMIVPRLRGVALVAMAAMTVTDLWLTIAGWNSVLPMRELYPRTPLVRAVEELHRRHPQNDPARMIGIGTPFYPNVSAMYGIEDVRVHDPMANAKFVRFLELTGGWKPGDYYARWNETQSGVIDFMNARMIVTERDAPLADSARFEEVYSGRDGRVYLNRAALPRFFAARNVVVEGDRNSYLERVRTHRSWADTVIVNRIAGATEEMRRDLLSPRPPAAKEARVEIVSAGEDRYRLRVSAPRHTLVVSSVALWPGWRITASGRGLRPVEINGAFLGFVAPPGEWEVSVRYLPVTFYGGVVASLVAAIALLMWTRRQGA